MKVAIGLGTSLARLDRGRTLHSLRSARRALLELTLRRLDAIDGLELLRVSPWVTTPPMRGGTARGVFLNGVALFESQLLPVDVLDACVLLEASAGRRRGRWWGDRTLDLDVLLVEGVILDTPRLKLPHPAIADRPFVLHPLLAVWPDAIDPRSDAPWSALPSPRGPKAAPAGRVASRRPLGYL